MVEDAERAQLDLGGIEHDKRSTTASNIDIFLRIKPVSHPTNRIVIDPLDGNVAFNIPRNTAAGSVNNSRENYYFSFNGILTPEAKQDEVFERVAHPVITSALEGFNGTIFAYGQTGSGKTFTITGGAERYVDRGIIPRTLACIYSELANRADYNYQVQVSYLEIYNETGYDLLDPTREVQAMEDLPQVYIQEDEEQQIHFKNLSIHRAASEEEALNLLFLGDTNRTISETPMNQASSRGHCIFTIMLEARKAGSDMIRRSKLHLVDLAGSERVGKTGVDGTILKEAKYINLSLHYLEQVIVALQERSMGLSRGHVPYRNSLMTLVLRDSLGGNCRTVMVATISGEAHNMEESISTCRFAQRVALVRNEASINEEVDPATVIKRLKQEIRDLKDELQLLRGGAAERGPLTPDELDRLKQQLLSYVADASDMGSLNLGGDMMMIRATWQIFKQLLRGHHVSQVSASTSTPCATANTCADVLSATTASTSDKNEVRSLQDQVRKLELQVKQRDSEIQILTGMLKGKSTTTAVSRSASMSDTAAITDSNGQHMSTSAACDAAATPSSSSSTEVLSALLDTRLLLDRHKAFEVFRRSYRQGEVIEDNKQLLKAKYDQAKALGASVNASKVRINELRAQIEQWRMQRSAACISDGQDPMIELQQDDPKEQQAKQQIEQEKASYKAAFSQLRGLKGEIEHLQMLLEQSRQKLQNDFQQWMALIARQQQQQDASVQQHNTEGTISGSDSMIGVCDQPCSVQPGKVLSSGEDLGRCMSSLETRSSVPSTCVTQQTLRHTETVPTAGVRSSLSQPVQISSKEGSIWSNSRNTQGTLDLSKVDPQILQAASLHLTGNPAADEDIIKFYEARAKLLQKLKQQQ